MRRGGIGRNKGGVKGKNAEECGGLNGAKRLGRDCARRLRAAKARSAERKK